MNTSAETSGVKAANRLGLNYRDEAARLGAPPTPITDAHSHIHGVKASLVYKEVRELYGVELTYSMSSLGEAEDLKAIFGDTLRFIAVPRFLSDDRKHAFTQGYVDDLVTWHSYGSRMCKFWCAPRSVDYGEQAGDPKLLSLDHPWRRKQMDKATELGMMFMVHIADPDTWFAKKYHDASKYGTKLDQYTPLERMLENYSQPVIAAHMGGWPEDLAFLRRMLEKHPNLHLDSSATKWMVRELSKQPREDLLALLTDFKGRILFGSDIVTLDEHVSAKTRDDFDRSQQASSPEEAFDLYASRYWALRTLWETNYDGESPIADGDLHMMDPERYTKLDAPNLRGKSMPADILRSLYHDAADSLLGRWWREHA